MSPRARKLPAEKKGWLTRAVEGLDAKTVTMLVVAALAGLGYQDNRQHAQRSEEKAQAASSVARGTRGRLTARVDSLAGALEQERAEHRTSDDLLARRIARMERALRARPATTVITAPPVLIGPDQPPDDELEDEPPAPPEPPKKRGLWGRLWEAIKPGQ